MKNLIKDWWPLLLIAGWWLLWRRYGKKKPAQTHEKIQTREDAINYLKENFIGISGVVGWSHRDLDPETVVGIPANDPNYSDFIPGLSINGKEYVTAEYGDSLMAAFRVLFGDAPVKAMYNPPFMIPGHGMSCPAFRVIFSSDESATDAREFLNNLFPQPQNNYQQPSYVEFMGETFPLPYLT